MVCPPKNRVGDALTGRFVPALAEERMSMTPRALNSIQQNRRFLDWLRTTDRKLVEIIYRTGRLRCGCLKTFLSDWRLAAIVDDTMPPRDPNDDDDEEDDEDAEDEEGDDEPPFVQGTRIRRIARQPL